MADTVRELLVGFGVEVDHKELDEFEHGLGGLVEKLKGVGAAITGFLAFGEIKEFFEGTIEQGAHLDDMSKKLGIGTEELQKFQYAASLAGVGAEESAHSLGLLNRQIGNAVTGGGESAKEFQKLGIHLKDASGQIRPVGDVISDLADKFKDMKSPQERAAYAMKLFGRAGQQLVPLLSGGSEALKKTSEEFEGLGGMMSEEFVKSAKEADDQLIKMHVTMEGIRIRAVNTFLPSIMGMVESFKRFGKGVQEVLDQTHALSHAWEFLKALGIAAAVWKIVSAVKALTEAEALADLASPFTLAILAIGLLYVAYDDLKTALEGGDSVFGRAFGTDGINALKEAIEATKGVVDLLLASLNMVWDVMKGLGSASKVLVDMAQAANPLDTKNSVMHGKEAVTDWHSAWGHLKDAFTPGKNIEALKTDVGMNTPLYQPPAPMGPPEASGAFTGPPTIQQTVHLNVDVKHSGKESPGELGRGVGQGAKGALDKLLLNSLNAGKKA